MDAMEAILTRHSIKVVKPDPVAHELIKSLLQAAVQAPNHYNVRPWRFVVLTGKSREALGEVMAQALKKQNPELPDSGMDIERAKPCRAPVLIAVGVDKPGDLRVLQIENICATAAAVENLLLAAHAQGLGGMWRTGPATQDLDIKKFLGFDREQEIIGFVYIGYPNMVASSVERPSFEDRTVWME
jgi:nitroreductase